MGTQVIAQISLIEAVLSLLGALYLVANCASCAALGAQAPLSHRRAVRAMLFHVGVADVAASVSWILTQIGALASFPAGPGYLVVCTASSALGTGAFVAMSTWTCMLASRLHGALALHSLPSALSRGAVLGGWALPAVVTALILPGHIQACDDTHAPSSHTLELVETITFHAVFLGVTIFTSLYLTVQYARIRRQFQRVRGLAMPTAERATDHTEPLAEHDDEAIPAAEQRTSFIEASTLTSRATKIDMRLLS